MRSSAASVAAVWAAVGLGVAALSGCGVEELAQPARDHRSVEAAEAPASASQTPRLERAVARGPSDETGRAAARRIGERPMWAENRRYSAEENAAYQFEQHGQELDARDLDDFLRKAHRFVNDPPDGTLTLTRENGDRLLYDAGSGLSGVARQDGAPRTVLKPRDGEAYWAAQVRENQQGQRAGARREREGG